jgi:hypothetical protein
VAADRDFQIAINGSGGIDLYLRGVTTNSPPGYANGSWHHTVVTWNGTTAVWYINNSVYTSNASVGTSPEDPLESIFIGARTSGGGFRFIGSVDDVRIYNRALTADEVNSLYTYQPGAEDPEPPTGISAIAIDSQRIDLVWTKGTDDTGILVTHIKRCKGMGCTTYLEHDTSAGTSYSDTGLTPSTIYRYVLYSEDFDGNFSADTSVVEATTPGDIITGVPAKVKLGVYYGGNFK